MTQGGAPARGAIWPIDPADFPSAGRRLEALHLTGHTPVIVVAADDGFRHSLVFALEAEGFSVVPYRRLAPAMAWLAGAPGLCVVVDEDALHGPGAWSRLTGLGHPVILLLDSGPAPGHAANTSVLRKPLFGNALVESIASLTKGD